MNHTNIQSLHEIPERYSQWFHVITELNQGFYEITEYDRDFMKSLKWLGFRVMPDFTFLL